MHFLNFSQQHTSLWCKTSCLSLHSLTFTFCPKKESLIQSYYLHWMLTMSEKVELPLVFLKGLLIQGKQVTCGLLESFYTPCCTVSFHSMTAYLTSCSERSKLQSLYFQSEYIFVENSLIHSFTTSQKKTVFGNILLNMNKLKSLRMLWGSWHCQNMNSLSATSISWVSKNIWVQMKKITAAWKLGRKALRGLRKRSPLPLPLSFPSSIPFCHFSFFNFVLKTWQNKQEGSNSW